MSTLSHQVFMNNYDNHSLFKVLAILLTVMLSIVTSNGQRLDLTQISSFDEFRYDLFEIAPDGTWFIQLGTGEFLRSTDMGSNWEPMTLPLGEMVTRIRFFNDSSLFIETIENNFYSQNGNQWIHLSDIKTNSKRIFRANGVVDVEHSLTIHNDTIWFALDSLVNFSHNKGISTQAAFQSNDLKIINTIRVNDKHIYLMGTSSSNSSYKSFYEKYNKIYELKEEVNTDASIGRFGILEVSHSDSVATSIVYGSSGSDAYYHETFLSIDSQFRPHDFRVNGDKVYFTFDGYNFGVYDFITQELNTYEINQQGKIHFYKDKIFISDKNRILDVTGIQSGQILEIIPDLKRNYTTALEYKISNEGVIYAYTGFNIFVHSSLNNWKKLDLENNAIVDFGVSQRGIFYAISNRNLFSSGDDGMSIQSKQHNCFFFVPFLTLGVGSLISMEVFDDNTLYLYGKVPGSLGGLRQKVSIDKGETFTKSNSTLKVLQLGNDGVFTNGRVLIDPNSLTPLWDENHPDLIGLPFGYEMLAIDAGLIYQHPGDHSNTVGFNLVTQDLGLTWTKTSLGPIGKIYKGSDYESSWVHRGRDGRLYYRKDLSSPYEEIDISSHGYSRNILSAPNGLTYFDRNGELFVLSDLIFHPQRISGELFYDDNNNCNYDSGEDLIGQSWTFSLTGSNYSLTTISNDGFYDFDVPLGDFKLEVHSPSELWTLCDSVFNVSVINPGQSITQDIGVRTDELCVELQVSLTTPKVKRCKRTRYTLNVHNTGTLGSSDVHVDITPDPFFEFLPINLAVPFEILASGDIRLNIGSLDIQESKRVQLLFDVSCASDLGQQHCMTASVASDNLCNSMATEVFTEYQNNVGPFDPNDMRVFNKTGYQALNFEKEERQYYHVRYQNTGTDTAENVEVRVVINDSLDISTLKVLDGSHDHTFSLNDAHNLTLKFDNIMLPDSFVNEAASNGYFRFSLLPKREVNEGQKFKSYADIYFDFNSPIRTNICESQIGMSCGVPIVEEVDVHLCWGETYDGYSRSGYYADYFTSSAGCDSIRKLNLEIQTSKFNTADNIYLCTGESYNGIISDTLVRDTFLTIFGCDSILRQFIYMSDWNADTELSYLACLGDTILGHYESGIYIDTIRSRNSCYRRIVDLTIIQPEFIQESYQLCSGETLDSITVSGIYHDTIRNLDLCDSIIFETVVEIFEEIKTTISIQGCEGELYEGYSQNGIYTDVFISQEGCDSIRTLMLDIAPEILKYESVSICRGDEYFGYSDSGIYLDTLVSILGCDSIRTLELEVFEQPSVEYSHVVCYGDNVEGHSESGSYEDVFTGQNGCDSTRILHLDVLSQSIGSDTIFLCPWEKHQGNKAPSTLTSNLTDANGCDSLLLTELLLVERKDPACAFPYDLEPKSMTQTDLINVNPNPVVNEFTIEVKKAALLPSVLMLSDINDKLIHEYKIEERYTSIDISHLPMGVYQVILKSGLNIYVHRLLKV